MFELAGAVFQLRVVQVEQVVQQYLREAVTPDDPAGALLSALREEDLFPRGVDHPSLDKLLEQTLGARLRGGAQHLRAARLPPLPKGPEKFEDLVLAVLGHFRLPLEKRSFTKFTTFDSGMGKEYPHPGQQTSVHPLLMGHPERQARSFGSISRWHSGHRILRLLFAGFKT
jgi:hypothetical protein